MCIRITGRVLVIYTSLAPTPEGMIQWGWVGPRRRGKSESSVTGDRSQDSERKNKGQLSHYRGRELECRISEFLPNLE